MALRDTPAPRTGTVAVLATAAVLLVAGCSDGDGPTVGIVPQDGAWAGQGNLEQVITYEVGFTVAEDGTQVTALTVTGGVAGTCTATATVPGPLRVAEGAFGSETDGTTVAGVFETPTRATGTIVQGACTVAWLAETGG